jgi:hypothetical protein
VAFIARGAPPPANSLWWTMARSAEMLACRGLPPEDWPKHQDIVWLLTSYRIHLHLNSTLCVALQKPHTERASLPDLYIAFTCTERVMLQYLSSLHIHPSIHAVKAYRLLLSLSFASSIATSLLPTEVISRDNTSVNATWCSKQ